MPRPKKHPHRVMLALDDDTYNVLVAMAALDNKPVATLVREFLQQLAPTLRETTRMVEQAKAGLQGEALGHAMQAVVGLQAKLGELSADVLEDARRAGGA